MKKNESRPFQAFLMVVLLMISTVLSLTIAPERALAEPGVVWTDWTTISSDRKTATGSITTGSQTITVTSTADSTHTSYSQIDGGGSNYWVPDTTYLSSDVNSAPPSTDILTLDQGGTVTITFSEPVRDPILGLVSWNSNTANFGVPIEVLSQGEGFYGTGTFEVNSNGDGFVNTGDAHGVIRLPGIHQSITFTHTTENWHGFTVGVLGVPTSSVNLEIDALTNNKENPVVKSLTAGTYKVHLLSQKEGGKFDAYSVNSAPKNCDGDGKNCSKGWETRYYVKPPYNKVVDNSCSELKNGGCRYESAAQAAANAPEDLVLTLEKDTDVKFYIQDSKRLENNQGGLTLQIIKQ